MTQPDLPTPDLKMGRRMPSVWLIPLVAFLIGAWLVIQTIVQQGPTIAITFETAEGLQPGKTEIRFRDVTIGKVTEVHLSEEGHGVVASAEMLSEATPYLTDTARFWVVRPRFGVKEISGLGTLVAGSYVEIDPGVGGKKKREFIGQELPPAIRADVPGKEFILTSENLGDLARGAPVYFKGIDVGEVLGYELDQDTGHVDVRIFVNAPYDKQVREGSRFWNVSGFRADIGPSGVELATGSLQSFIMGGVNFETPTRFVSMDEAPELTRFTLFRDKKHIAEAEITQRVPAILYFEESLRGLSDGAPVEFRGVRLGTVRDYRLEFNPDTLEYRMPVLIEFEPQRMAQYRDSEPTDEKEDRIELEKLIAIGLRARLETDSLITGAKYVELDILPKTKAEFFGETGGLIEIPTVPSELNKIASSASELLSKMSKAVDGAQKVTNAPELMAAIRNLNKTMVAVERFTANLNQDLALEAKSALTEAHRTLRTLRKAMDEQSPLRYDMENMMKDLSAAARAVRGVADYLERNPDALITGKKGNRP